MSKALRESLDNFDTDTLDSLEYSRYLLLLQENSHRLALLKLALNYDNTSIGLLSLKWAIEQQEKNIKYYE
jgi:hypothetical protein